MLISADTLALLLKHGIQGEALLEVCRSIESDQALLAPAPTEPLPYDEAAERRRVRDREYRRGKRRVCRQSADASADNPPTVETTISFYVQNQMEAEDCVGRPSADNPPTTPSLDKGPPDPLKLNPTLPPSPPKGGSSPKPNGFARFWEAYPSKVGKRAAEKAFERAEKIIRAEDRDPLPVMLAAIERSRRSERWTEGYVPNPATWLNQGRWDDEPELPPPKAAWESTERHSPAPRRDLTDEERAERIRIEQSAMETLQ